MAAPLIIDDSGTLAGARLHRIARGLILRSFPSLRRIRLHILWGSEDDLLYYAVENGRREIRVNHALRPAPKRVLQGGLAHELCHVAEDLRLSRRQRELAWNRYLQSRRFRMREERATERNVIALGYGFHLLAFVRFAQRLGHRFSKEHGLLYAEIYRALKNRQDAPQSKISIVRSDFE